MKHDEFKPRLELIDTEAELLLGMVLTAGALEYNDDNWRGLNTAGGRDRVIGALMRHLNKCRLQHADDIAIDDQFGLPHSAHLLACAMFLAAFDAERLHMEDRWDGAVDTWRSRLMAMKEKQAVAVEKLFDTSRYTQTP